MRDAGANLDKLRRKLDRLDAGDEETGAVVFDGGGVDECMVSPSRTKDKRLPSRARMNVPARTANAQRRSGRSFVPANDGYTYPTCSMCSRKWLVCLRTAGDEQHVDDALRERLGFVVRTQENQACPL